MEKFITELSKCRDPAVLLGIYRILCGPFPSENPPEFYELIESIFKGYKAAPRKRRRELLKILKAANKGAKDNGNVTEKSTD